MKQWSGTAHLNIPNNSGAFGPNTVPGAGAFGGNVNPNNFFASQWTLGREAILLNEVDGAAMTDSNGMPQNYLQQDTVTPGNLYPLAYGTTAKLAVTGDTGTTSMNSSRYDIADTAINTFTKQLRTQILDTTTNPSATYNWWSRFMATDQLRFRADPFLTKPITSEQFAKASPIFIPGCSQFIVEFAGDFIKQLPTGALDISAGPGTAFQPDGVIDFVVAPGASTTNPSRQIRWYGMPRNTDSTNDSAAGEVISNALNSLDVVPARDVRGDGTHFEFERVVTGDSAKNILNAAMTSDYAGAGAVPSQAYYVCAWGPTDTNRPQLIRITYSIDDPASRLGTPLTYEYVFKLK